MDKAVHIGESEVTYTYHKDKINSLSLEELASLCIAVGEYGIGPRVTSTTHNTVTVEKIEMMLIDFDFNEDKHVNPILIDWADNLGLDLTSEVEAALKITVDILHNEIGYVHGDLHGGNLGFRIEDNKLKMLIIDLDTAFPIVLGRYMPSVINWMEISSDIDDYDEFIAYDYNNDLMLL